MPKRSWDSAFASLAQLVATDHRYFGELKDHRLQYLQGSLVQVHLGQHADLRNWEKALPDFKDWVRRNSSLPEVVEARKAIDAAHAAKKSSEREKYGFIDRLWLNPDNNATKCKIQALWASIPIIRVKARSGKGLYPPPKTWVVESKTIQNLWKKHIRSAPLPDKRGKRHPIHMLQRHKLQYNLRADESAIFVDADSDEVVMVVMRGFCKNTEVVSWINEVVLKNIEAERNIRVGLCLVYCAAGYLRKFCAEGGCRLPCYGWWAAL